MKNPWTKKNPFMSMWLSGANTMLGKARGHATAAANAGARQMADLWANAFTASGRRRKRRKGS